MYYLTNHGPNVSRDIVGKTKFQGYFWHGPNVSCRIKFQGLLAKYNVCNFLTNHGSNVSMDILDRTKFQGPCWHGSNVSIKTKFPETFGNVKCLYHLMNHGPNISIDFLDRTKYQGTFGMDQMSPRTFWTGPNIKNRWIELNVLMDILDRTKCPARTFSCSYDDAKTKITEEQTSKYVKKDMTSKCRLAKQSFLHRLNIK